MNEKWNSFYVILFEIMQIIKRKKKKITELWRTKIPHNDGMEWKLQKWKQFEIAKGCEVLLRKKNIK